MTRTIATKVRGLVDCAEDVNLDNYIDMAASVTDWLAGQDTDGVLSSTTLELIERNLAAHFYQSSRDRALSSKATGRASGTFQGQTGYVLMSTDPGQNACFLDVTGKLAQRSKEVEEGGRRRAGITWMGTASQSPEDTNAG